MPAVTKDLSDDLLWRGLLHQVTSDHVWKHLQTPGRLGYIGFDPTSDSLHIGSLLQINALIRFQMAGHCPIAVMGGATGLIGDPSGKSSERKLLDEDQIQKNVTAQKAILERFLDFSPSIANPAQVLDNRQWLGALSFIDVLRDIGKHFYVNAMIQKESVSSRLKEREQGISFTEFSYMILQAYDFYHLYKTHGCTVQMGGSDQYGNIVSGIDLVHRLCRSGHHVDGDDHLAFGVTSPLVTRSDGGKFGKTEDGAIWLTPDRTSPYRFYQYWLNVSDDEVVSYLKWFTFLQREQIQEMEQAVAQSPHERAAQKKLAAEVTEQVHGPTERTRAEEASKALFSGDVHGLDASLLQEVFEEVPHSDHDKSALEAGLSLVELLPLTSLVSSKREAREFLSNNAISVNGQRVDPDRALQNQDLLHGRTILLRRGKKNWHALHFS